MVALLFCADSITAVLKGSRDPAVIPWVLIAHPLAVLVTLQLFAKLEVSSFTRSKYRPMQAVPKI